MQLEFAVEMPVNAALATRLNVFGTGIDVHIFGRGFPWRTRHYQNWGEGGKLLLPYLEKYKLKEALVPDFRGMNALICGGSTQELVSMDTGKRLWRTAMPVDGLKLEKERSVLAISADCCTVGLFDTLHGRGFALHCGRDALHPLRRNGSRRQGRESVIDAAMAQLMPTNVREVRALILCGIGPQSFENRAEHSSFHKHVVAYFVQSCGKCVVSGDIEEGRLNIPLIIRTQLGRWGVGLDDHDAVVWDGIDTYADESFYSRRRGSEGNNCMLFDMTRAFA